MARTKAIKTKAVTKAKRDLIGASAKLAQRSKTIGDVRDKTLAISDVTFAKFLEEGDLRLAMVALSGYKTAIAATKAQLMHQKLTGTAKRIPFCEG